MDSPDLPDEGWLSFEDTPFHTGPHMDFLKKIAEVLLLPAWTGNQREMLFAICLPAGDLEWAVQLFHSAEPDDPAYCHYFLIASMPDKKVGDPDNGVKVQRMEAEVSEEIATALYQTWRTMLQRITPHRSTECEERTYHFACDCRLLSGQTWSPMEDTPAERLILLSEAPYAFPQSPEALRTELASRILATTNWFKTLN